MMKVPTPCYSPTKQEFPPGILYGLKIMALPLVIIIITRAQYFVVNRARWFIVFFPGEPVVEQVIIIASDLGP